MALAFLLGTKLSYRLGINLVHPQKCPLMNVVNGPGENLI